MIGAMARDGFAKAQRTCRTKHRGHLPDGVSPASSSHLALLAVGDDHLADGEPVAEDGLRLGVSGGFVSNGEDVLAELVAVELLHDAVVRLALLETASCMAAAAFLRAAAFACLLTAGAFFFFSALAAFFSALAALLRPATTSRRATRGAAVCGSGGEARVRR